MLLLGLGWVKGKAECAIHNESWQTGVNRQAQRAPRLIIMRTIYWGRLLVFAAVSKSKRVMPNTEDPMSYNLTPYVGKHTNVAWGVIHVAKF